MKTEMIEVIRFSEVLNHYKHNYTKIAKIVNANRSTVRRWVDNNIEIFFTKDRNGKLQRFMGPDGKGQHKKVKK